MSKNISNKISIYSFIMTIFIVFYHNNISAMVELKGKKLNLYSAFANHLGFVCMVFFFFISGFLLYYGIKGKEDIIPKVKRRVKSLIIPFVLWHIIIYLYFLIFQNTNYIHSSFDIFKFLVLNPLDGPLWYILAIFMFLIFMPFIVYFKTRNKKVLNIILSCVIIIFLLRNFGLLQFFDFSFDYWWWFGNMIGYLPYYLLGVFVAINIPFFSKFKIKSSISSLIGILVVVVSLFAWYKIYGELKYYAFISFFELIGLWLAFPNAIFKSNLKKITSSSFFIYALHQPILIPLFNNIIKNNIDFIVLKTEYIVLINMFEIVVILCVAYVVFIVLNLISKGRITSVLSGGRS